jgi:hypothetical protein
MDEDDEQIDYEYDYPSPHRRVSPTWPGLELHYLQHGFAWLEMATSEDILPDEAVDAIGDLLVIALRTVPAKAREGRMARTPYPSKFDQWLFERIAPVLIKLDRVGRANSLWQSILELGLRGEQWPRFFLSGWFKSMSGKRVQPEEFIPLWGRMILFAVESPNWNVTHARGDDMVNELLGFVMGKTVFGGEASYAPAIGRLVPVFALAAGRWFSNPQVATAFCQFSLKPAGAGLLLHGVGWLAAAEPEWSDYAWDHLRLADALVHNLRVAFDRHHAEIATNSVLREGFITLCNKLIARGHPASLTLRERVAAVSLES